MEEAENNNKARIMGAAVIALAGGSLQACIGFCPSDNDGSEYGKCVEDCGNNC